MYFFRSLFLKLLKVNNWVLISASFTLILFSTIMVTFLEPETFPTLFEGFWWVMTTVTTVGYGDYYPVTVLGRSYAVILYLIGIGLIGVLIGKIVEWFADFRKKREEGKMEYRGKNHIVIIGWSKKAKFAVEEIMESSDTNVVVIDQLERAPLLNERVHYIQGNATKELTMKMSNVQHAKAVLIFSDDTIKEPELADGKTLLIASTIESYAPKVHTTVEILDEEHIKNFTHVNVDEFVLSHETISRLSVRSVFMNGVTSIYSQLMSHTHGDDLFQVGVRQNWNTYRDAFEALLQEGATLIADGDELNINRRLDEPIRDDAKLFVICDKETYQQVKK
ncbi:ion transporter [Bacillus solimangrovi]|uniref:Ion transporter n=1 Tax=Bacillus solimangrovi TaxID=1305675 RepID=A0A1E5LDG3_9BACI|nr:potassium channel family protein [Bacillus solimangrovi]OEH92128.1 ion transporter [Bacillus solimangrovi]